MLLVEELDEVWKALEDANKFYRSHKICRNLKKSQQISGKCFSGGGKSEKKLTKYVSFSLLGGLVGLVLLVYPRG